MKEKNRKQSLSWSMKKNIVIAVCSLVLISTMGISLSEQASKKQMVQEERITTEFVRKNVEQTANATNLYMNYAEVEQGENVSVEVSGAELDESNKTSGHTLAEETSGERNSSKGTLVSSADNANGDSVVKKSPKGSSVTYQEVSESTTKSGPKKAGKSKNRIVSNISRTGETKGNRVIENPEPLNYVEKIFSNHGIAPVIEEVVRKYQYPVEIGYSYDKNYDAKNEAGDFILNKVFETEELDLESEEGEAEEESKEEGSEKNDSTKIEEERSEKDDASEIEGENSEKNDASETEEESSEESDTGDAETDVLQSETSGDAVIEQEINSEDTKASKYSDEQEKLEEYRKDIWKQIVPTKPLDVEIEKKVMKTIPVVKEEASESLTNREENETKIEQETENSDETSESEMMVTGDVEETTTEGTAQEESQTTTEIKEDVEESVEQMTEEAASGDVTTLVETEAVAGYYIIRGKMREGSKVYVSDIEIIPVGIDGFDKVRVGEDGEFKDSVVLTEDAVNREIKLYFTDGEIVTEATTFTYSKDTITPELQWLEERYTLLQSADRKIYCTKEDTLPVKVVDGEDNDGETLERIQYLYGTKLQSVEDGFDSPEITMYEDFYGRLLLSCCDKAGNVSDIQSQFVLVDHNEPVIQLAQDTRCSAPYSLWVNVEETGHIVSGIQTIQCVVDGNIYDVSESMVRETYTLDEGLEVSSKITFPIELKDIGIHAVSILVRDYAGNETIVEQNIEVTEPELVSIYMPRNFTIHIDPQKLAGKEQIYSDNVELKNVSKFDVRVNIDKVVLNVNDEVSADGILKDCDIYFVAPDTGEKIPLSKGENDNVYSYRLPVEAMDDLANIRFVGTTTAGSEKLWKGSDISLSLQVSFIKWEEENGQ